MFSFTCTALNDGKNKMELPEQKNPKINITFTPI